MSLHSSVTSLHSLSKSKKGAAGAGNTYDIVAVKTKSSEIKPYEGDGKSLESLNLREDMRAKHEQHWKGCPNYSSLYGEGAQLNHNVLNPPSKMSEDGSSISHGGISYQRTGSGKYRAADGSSCPGSALGAIFKDEESIKFGGVTYERTGSGNFISKDGSTLNGGAMAAIFGGFAANGDLGGFDQYNLDGSVKVVAPPLPFGRFAAIDSVVAEGQNRMANHKKSQIVFDEVEDVRPSKSKKPSAMAYSTEYQRSFSGEERMTSADRIKSGEVYRVVVDNLRQNLEVIKNYEENRYGTLNPSNLYLSIINAALHGPHRVSLSEAEYALGIGKSAIAKATWEVKHEWRRKQDIITGSFIHSRESSRKFDPYGRLHQKDPAEALRQHFQSYAAFGKDRHKDGSHITLSQIDRWFKQAQVVDGDNITTTDTGIVFKKISGSCAWITFREFLKFLEVFGEDFNIDIDALKKKLGTAGPPCPGNATEADNVPVVKRLTNPSKFPGTHNNPGQAIAAM